MTEIINAQLNCICTVIFFNIFICFENHQIINHFFRRLCAISDTPTIDLFFIALNQY